MPPRPRPPRAFTLIETVVVLAIVAFLIFVMLPSLNRGRSLAQRWQCMNNLKIIGLAMHNYADAQKTLPPMSILPSGITSHPWSAFVRLLPYLDAPNSENQMNLAIDREHTDLSTLAGQRISTFICPSDPNLKDRETRASASYGFNTGTWFIHDPVSGAGGDGAFAINRAFTLQQIVDGLATTLAASDCNAEQSLVRNSKLPAALGAPPPDSPGALAAFLGGRAVSSDGHTRWAEGTVAQTGFTTTFTPNTSVDHQKLDIDFTSITEGESTTAPTYAAVTARSHHGGGVNVLFMDGSVRFVKDTIALKLWRSLGTREGGETITLESY